MYYYLLTITFAVYEGNVNRPHGFEGDDSTKARHFWIHDTKVWSNPGGRATMPEVTLSIKNTYFLSDSIGDETPAGRLGRNFRHPAGDYSRLFLNYR
jgi:hypothetical protein